MKVPQKLRDAHNLCILGSMARLEQDRARLDNIAATAALSKAETGNRLREMQRLGLVRVERRIGFFITDAGAAFLNVGRKRLGELPPISDSLRQRLWQAIRVLRKWQPEELFECAVRPDDAAPEQAIAALCSDLLAAEVIQQLPTRPGQPPRYRLARDLGPIAPSWRKSYGALWDWNANKLLATEAAPGAGGDA